MILNNLQFRVLKVSLVVEDSLDCVLAGEYLGFDLLQGVDWCFVICFFKKGYMEHRVYSHSFW